MIDWAKERATKNYCGWCGLKHTDATCDGSCFKDSKENRVDHVLEMLKSIPEQIEQLKIKEQDYKDALSA